MFQGDASNHPYVIVCAQLQERELELKGEEVSGLRKRLDDHKRLKKEMKVLKDKLNTGLPHKGDLNRGNKNCVPPSTPTRKQAKTPLRMTRPPKYNESPEVRCLKC